MTKMTPAGSGRLADVYPEVWENYAALGKSAENAGKLDARTRRLFKLALPVGASGEGAGFPAAMAAYSWVNDILAPGSADPARRP